MLSLSNGYAGKWHIFSLWQRSRPNHVNATKQNHRIRRVKHCSEHFKIVNAKFQITLWAIFGQSNIVIWTCWPTIKLSRMMFTTTYSIGYFGGSADSNIFIFDFSVLETLWSFPELSPNRIDKWISYSSNPNYKKPISCIWTKFYSIPFHCVRRLERENVAHLRMAVFVWRALFDYSNCGRSYFVRSI